MANPAKKFVFQIYPENVPYVESLSYEKKNEVINDLLFAHTVQLSEKQKNRRLINSVTRIFIIIFIVLAGIPVFLIFVNYCFDTTQKNYTQMQRNFERLFNERKN